MPSVAAASHVAAALEYCHGVIAGEILACRWTRRACERHLNDFERFQDKDAPYYFDEKQAERVCNILEHFPHIRGEWAKYRQRIELVPWQSFIVMVVFG